MHLSHHLFYSLSISATTIHNDFPPMLPPHLSIFLPTHTMSTSILFSPSMNVTSFLPFTIPSPGNYPITSFLPNLSTLSLATITTRMPLNPSIYMPTCPSNSAKHQPLIYTMHTPLTHHPAAKTIHLFQSAATPWSMHTNQPQHMFKI